MKHQIVVVTVALDGTTTGGVKVIDWSNSSDRKWLMNHLHWAMHNGRQVQLAPCENKLNPTEGNREDANNN